MLICCFGSHLNFHSLAFYISLFKDVLHMKLEVQIAKAKVHGNKPA